MPPPHHFLAPRLRGYVCKACLSRLQVTRRGGPIWLSRNASSGRWSSLWKKVNPQTDQPEPVIREFIQTPDGVRREIQEDYLKEIGDEIKRQKTGQGLPIDDLIDDDELEELLHDEDAREQLDEMLQDADEEFSEEILESMFGETMEAMTKTGDELEALTDRLEKASEEESLSPDEISRIREELLQDITAGMCLLLV